MNGTELLRIVDSMHRDKNIPKEVIFEGIEAALQLAARKHFNEAEDITIAIDRESGDIEAKKGTDTIDPEVLGRIAAQSAKQVMIQKIREAECNAVFDEFVERKGDLVLGIVQRFEGGSAIVSVDKTEALLPRSEQIPGETHHVGQRVKSVILEVRKVGSRVRIILSRTHPDFVRRLFEQEIPEIADRTIDIKALAREAGYRTKIAVSSIDTKVDAVGACVGVRGSRIKNIVDELGGERIDIVRWNESLQVMIPNALQPAAIEEVFLYPRLGRAIVLVKEDQLSLAIGRRGQNVRLASKLVGWDIEIMTHEELSEGIERAEGWFGIIPGITDEVVEAFIQEGFLSYDDLTFLEPAEFAELAGVTEEQAQEMIAYAEAASEQVEEEEQRQRAEREAAEAAAPSEGEAVEAAASGPPLRSGAGPRASDLFPEGPAPDLAEAKPTLEDLFGPDTEATKAEQPLSAEQVFGDQPPPPPPKKDDDE
jgi:N utilization substance protein A